MKNKYFNKTYIRVNKYGKTRTFQINEYVFNVEEDSIIIEVSKNNISIAVIAANENVFCIDDKSMLQLAIAYINNYETYGTRKPFQIGMSSYNEHLKWTCTGFLKIGNYFLTDCDPHFDEDYDDIVYGK